MIRYTPLFLRLTVVLLTAVFCSFPASAFAKNVTVVSAMLPLQLAGGTLVARQADGSLPGGLWLSATRQPSIRHAVLQAYFSTLDRAQSLSSSQTVAPPENAGVSADEQRAWQLLNADRQKNGLAPLRLSGDVSQLAETYARDMIGRHFFSHYNPEGLSPFDRMKRAGIRYRYAGENLALNSDIAAAENAFMNSAGHRENILNPHYSEVGIGVQYDKNGSVYVVQEFIGQ